MRGDMAKMDARIAALEEENGGEKPKLRRRNMGNPVGGRPFFDGADLHRPSADYDIFDLHLLK